MSGRTCRGRQAGALRKRLLAGQIIFKAFFPMDQAGQTCDDDFGRTEFVNTAGLALMLLTMILIHQW